MDWRNDIIKDFGKLIGINDLSLDEKNTLTLNLNEQMSLSVELQDESALIYILISLDGYDNLTYYTKALKLSHYSNPSPYTIQTALKDDDTLCLCVFLNNNEFTENNLSQIMENLIYNGENLLIK